ncbi:MAG: hypothetical protein RTU09_04195 [Candidatus Thorarchaeota archaeon]
MRGMFRIYTCPSCGALAYTRVESEEETSQCGLCRTPVLHQTGMLYAVTTQEAENLVSDLVHASQVENDAKSRSTRGIGVRRRVLDIVESLVSENRGRPIEIERFMKECIDARIKPMRGLHFLDILEEEGLIVRHGEAITLEHGGGFG